MKIGIDLDELIKLELSPDEFVILKLLSEGVSSSVSLFVDPEKLFRMKYINIDFENDLPVLKSATITDKGRELFGDLKDVSKVENWIDEWRGLFPEGIKQAGQPVRGVQRECLKKMIFFMKEYKDFSKTIIFEATKYYVAINKKDNYKYIKRAHYFIKKDDESVLASLCEEIKEAGKNTKSNINNINKTQKGSEEF